MRSIQKTKKQNRYDWVDEDNSDSESLDSEDSDYE